MRPKPHSGAPLEAIPPKKFAPNDDQRGRVEGGGNNDPQRRECLIPGASAAAPTAFLLRTSAPLRRNKRPLGNSRLQQIKRPRRRWPPSRDRWFESPSLHQRVGRTPNFPRASCRRPMSRAIRNTPETEHADANSQLHTPSPTSTRSALAQSPSFTGSAPVRRWPAGSAPGLCHPRCSTRWCRSRRRSARRRG
jgi:hypothetical protein